MSTPSDIDSKPVLALELEGRLKTLFVTRPGAVLFIDGAPELEYAGVASIIDMGARSRLEPGRIADGKDRAVNGIVGNWAETWKTSTASTIEKMNGG
jgi:hypothetical protein